MRRLILVFFVLSGGLVHAQPAPVSRFNGLVIFQNGDTLQGRVRVDVPGNQVYVGGGPVGERVFTASEVKYINLERPRTFVQHPGSESPVPLAELIGMARTATYISADYNGHPALFEVIETGPRVVLLHHPRATLQRSAFWMTDPWTAQLRKDWLDPPSSGFYLGDLTTNRIVPFRCSLPGLLRVLPYYHREIRKFAWQNPTTTLRSAIAYYNSLSPAPYYEVPKTTTVREKGR